MPEKTTIHFVGWLVVGLVAGFLLFGVIHPDDTVKLLAGLLLGASAIELVGG